MGDEPKLTGEWYTRGCYEPGKFLSRAAKAQGPRTAVPTVGEHWQPATLTGWEPPQGH